MTMSLTFDGTEHSFVAIARTFKPYHQLEFCVKDWIGHPGLLAIFSPEHLVLTNKVWFYVE